MNHKKFQTVSILLMILFLITACGKAETQGNQMNQTSPPTSTVSNKTEGTPLDLLEFNLTDGMDTRSDSADRITFLNKGTTVGGIFLLECDEAVFNDVLGYFDSLKALVIQAMQEVAAPMIEWEMGSSSEYGLQEFSMGTSDTEYIAYVVRGYSACYVVWFNRNQVDIGVETDIMRSLHSEDIVDELNKISTEDFMNALSESMANKTYCLEVPLPNGFSQESINNEEALFYSANQLVGGFKVVHFEKGILPAAQENADLIVETLRESVSSQVDLTDFNAKINPIGMITVTFQSGNIEYTHYILAFGQIGTQYDLWLETSTVGRDIAENIALSTRLLDSG